MDPELRQDLSARAAGSDRRRGLAGDRHRPKASRTGGDRRRHGVALRAHRQPVGRILDVAPGEDPAVVVEDGGADLEPRVGGVGVAPHLEGGARQLVEPVRCRSHLNIIDGKGPAAPGGAAGREGGWEPSYLRLALELLLDDDLDELEREDAEDGWDDREPELRTLDDDRDLLLEGELGRT